MPFRAQSTKEFMMRYRNQWWGKAQNVKEPIGVGSATIFLTTRDESFASLKVTESRAESRKFGAPVHESGVLHG